MFYFLFLALLMIVAFAQCVTMLFNDPGRELEFFKDFGHSCGTLFIAMLGIMDESQVNEMRDKYLWAGPTTIILYLLITSVILLNLLIAILSNIYKKIDEKSNEEWMFLWGSTVMKLQKEVTETLPPPLNVVLKVLMIFPKSIKDRLTFALLFFVAYLPGLVVLIVMWIPYKFFISLAIVANPENWSAGGGNPFKGVKIQTMDSSMKMMDMGRGDRRGFRGSAIAQFFEDNFTNAQVEMRGREKVSDRAKRGRKEGGIYGVLWSTGFAPQHTAPRLPCSTERPSEAKEVFAALVGPPASLLATQLIAFPDPARPAINPTS